MSKETDKIEFNGRTKVEDKFPTYLLVGTVLMLIAVSFDKGGNDARKERESHDDPLDVRHL